MVMGTEGDAGSAVQSRAPTGRGVEVLVPVLPWVPVGARVLGFFICLQEIKMSLFELIILLLVHWPLFPAQAQAAFPEADAV